MTSLAKNGIKAVKTANPSWAIKTLRQLQFRDFVQRPIYPGAGPIKKSELIELAQSRGAQRH